MSPQWLHTLKGHLTTAAVDWFIQDSKLKDDIKISEQILNDVVTLKVEEVLLFAPSVMVDTKTNIDQNTAIKRLSMKYLKIKIRLRLTINEGKSIMTV